MVVTFDGIIRLVMYGLVNTLLPIPSKPSGNTTSFNLLQFANALASISLSWEGNSTLSKLVRP